MLPGTRQACAALATTSNYRPELLERARGATGMEVAVILTTARYRISILADAPVGVSVVTSPGELAERGVSVVHDPDCVIEPSARERLHYYGIEVLEAVLG